MVFDSWLTILPNTKHNQHNIDLNNLIDVRIKALFKMLYINIFFFGKHYKWQSKIYCLTETWVVPKLLSGT